MKLLQGEEKGSVVRPSVDRQRVAIVTVDPCRYGVGGVTTMMSCMYKMLERAGFAPELFCTLAHSRSSGEKSAIEFQSVHTKRAGMDAYAMPRIPLPWSWTLSPLVFGWRAIQGYDMHVVVAGTSHVASLPALKRLPYILWVATVFEDELRSKVAVGNTWAQRILNSPVWPILQAQERFALLKARRILALSPYTARRIREIVPEAADRVEVLLCPIDIIRFRPDPAARVASAYGEYLLLTARINDPRKNAILLLRAFVLVRKQYPHLKLVLAGDTPGETLLRSVRELGIEEAVVFPGRVKPDSDELIRLYQAAKLYVLSSNQEGLGIVVLEAIACGLPVVSTRCWGPEAILNNEQTGRLVPKGDVEAFAQAVIDLLSCPDRLEQMRHACVRQAKEDFGWAVVEQQLSDVIEAAYPA